MRGKGSKLGEPCPKVRLGQDRLPIEPKNRRKYETLIYPDPIFSASKLYKPVDELVGEQVQPRVAENDKNLQDHKDEHQVRVDPLGDVVARVGSFGVHLVELYELEEDVDKRDESKDDCPEPDSQTSVALEDIIPL